VFPNANLQPKANTVRSVSSPLQQQWLSKGEFGISSYFGFNFDFVAQLQATATRKSDLGENPD